MKTFMDHLINDSTRLFGEGEHTEGLIAHIRSELKEVEAAPHDLEEWVDVIILALDGYWRHGGTPDTLMPDIWAKWMKVLKRDYPAPGTFEDVLPSFVRSK